MACEWSRNPCSVWRRTRTAATAITDSCRGNPVDGPTDHGRDTLPRGLHVGEGRPLRPIGVAGPLTKVAGALFRRPGGAGVITGPAGTIRARTGAPRRQLRTQCSHSSRRKEATRRLVSRCGVAALQEGAPRSRGPRRTHRPRPGPSVGSSSRAPPAGSAKTCRPATGSEPPRARRRAPPGESLSNPPSAQARASCPRCRAPESPAGDRCAGRSRGPGAAQLRALSAGN